MKPVLSIQTRLHVISTIAVIGVLLTAGFGYVGLQSSNHGLEEAITATTAVLNQKQADMMHDALRGDVLAALLTGPAGSAQEKDDIRTDLADHVASFEQSIANLDALALPPQIRARVEDVVPLLHAYIDAAEQITTLALQDAQSGHTRMPEFMAAFLDLEESMEALGELIESRGAETGSQAQERNRLLILVLLVASVVAAIALALTARRIAQGICQPLNAVRDRLLDVANGDLQVAIDGTTRGDEVGAIAKSLEVLRDRLATARERETELQQGAQHRVVRALSIGLRNLSAGNLTQPIDEPFAPEYETLRVDYNTTLERLNQTISQVVAASESIRARSAEISHASEELSTRTENQAATLEQTAAALDELTASVKAAADSARDVEKVVHQARTEATESGTVVQGAVDAMNEIERSSEQISQIIGVIDDIAFQTNLLALNAGVEAARAGDAGRGFAVVASEVRALAQRSSAAAKEIKVLIGTSTQHVDRGVSQVGRAGTALASIVERVTEISTLVSRIATGAKEQAVGLAEVNIGVTQLDQVTQHNAAMVEESTSSSQSLKEEANGMASLVAQFRIRGGAPRDEGVVDHPGYADPPQRQRALA